MTKYCPEDELRRAEMWSGRLTKAIDKQEAWVKELKERRRFWQIIAMSMREDASQ